MGSASQSDYARYWSEFCSLYSKVSKTLQLDGYYAPQMQASSLDGHYDEVMLCVPFDSNHLSLVNEKKRMGGSNIEEDQQVSKKFKK